MKSIQFKPLDGKLFSTNVKSQNVKNSERWLGYFLGPALVACMNAICAQSYLNQFYTDVLKLSPIAGGLFLALMPLLSKIVDAVTNVAMGRIIDRTNSKQGKARPWLLFSGPLMAISSSLLFAVPESSLPMTIIWVTVSYNLYFCISYTMYNISNTLLVPLSTRNSKQRDTLAMASSMGISMIPGVLVSMLFPMVLLPFLGVDRGRWGLVMTIIGLLAIPATLIQYKFSRERVTEDSQASTQAEDAVSFGQQIKGCLSSKYWIVIMGIVIVYQLFNNFQITSTIYYCNWVLGTYNDGTTMTILNAIGQAPLGLGILILWPLVKRFGKRNVMIAGCAMGIVGGVICALNARNMGMVLIGLVLRSFGTLPITYTLTAMVADALDHVEWLNKFRCDGFSSSIYSIIVTVTTGISMGVFNLLLGFLGYVAPMADGSWVPQNAAVQNFFIAGMFIVPAAGLFLIGFLLGFFHVEKELPQMQADILQRHKDASAARGEVYVSPEEKAALEQAELDRVAEENRVKELKAHCVKKGLSVDAEEAKYQQKLADRKAKEATKANKGRK